MTDCTTRVDALATSNEATAMFSGGSSSTETSRTIVPARASAFGRLLSSGGQGGGVRASSSRLTPGTNRSSAESVSSVSPLARTDGTRASPRVPPATRARRASARAPTRGARTSRPPPTAQRACRTGDGLPTTQTARCGAEELSSVFVQV